MFDELITTVLKRYQTVLAVIARSCAQAIPVVGPDIEHLSGSLRLTSPADAAYLDSTARKVETEFTAWSSRAGRYYQAKTEEVREIMVAVAQVANCIGEHDQKYAAEIGELSNRLIAASRLDDLGEIRRCLAQDASTLNETADALMKSSRDSVTSLRAEVLRYETLLRESEQRACVDPLTGLQNRRGIERELHVRMQSRRTFCIIIFDINGFKRLNDVYGHVAGDDVLQQFAGELKSHCDGTDLAGRMGGDEFIIITERCFKEGAAYLNHVREWTFGKYKINGGGNDCQTAVLSAAAGLAEWDGEETIPALLSRADKAMYRDKAELLETTRERCSPLARARA